MVSSTFLSLLLPALVSAHGYVNKITIDGKEYQGNSVGTTATVQSVIRQVNSNSPVKGASNPDLNCGNGAQLAAEVANANPGSNVQVYWVGGTTGTSPWPHNTGPIMHYMAKCPDSCAAYNSSSAEWFKISEQGQKPGGSTWYQGELQSGSPATVTIPSNLAPGNYLMRSELITLQLAMSQGGAEFYPSCFQLSVGGSQSGQASSSEEVTFPGGYSDTDPGILTPNVYNPGFTYVFPGPPIASFISSSSGNETSTGPGNGGSTGSASPTNSGLPPSSSGTPPSTSTPTPPANPGGDQPTSAVPPTVSPTSTGGSGSTCTRYKRSAPPVEKRQRIHKRRLRTAH